ncbi:MAG: alpha-amylase [Gammaproteobacteria bacterium]|nr:alpha-amylase [Gammaproteobacteria bacterium]
MTLRQICVLGWCALLMIKSVQADVILHAFNWHYDEVTEQASTIAAMGYKHVLIVPPVKSARFGCAWWQRYQPQDYRVIDHCKGNKQSLVRMINTLNQYDISVYADVILNHMANERGNSQSFPGSDALASYQSNAAYWQQQQLFGNLENGLLSANDFHQPGQCIQNYNDVGDVQWNRLCGGNGDPGLPDLTDNSWVIWQQRQYLLALKGLGIKGFRLDAAKHMSLAHIQQVFDAEVMADTHVFGEVITNGGAGEGEYERFLAPYLSATGHAAYDFPLFTQIRQAFSFSGSLQTLINPSAYGQALAKSKAITFVLTHDIPNNDGFRFYLLDAVDERLAYAYILGRDGGVPLVYSDHGESGARDNGRWYDDFKASDLQVMIGFHNAMQGQTDEVIAASDCALLLRRGEEGLLGINKCGHTVAFNVSTHNRFKWFRDYVDLKTGATDFRIESGSQDFYIAPRSWQMWQVR